MKALTRQIYNDLIQLQLDNNLQKSKELMSIMKQINYDEFTKIVGIDEFHKFVESTLSLSVVLFITDWSVPSKLTVKRLKKMPFKKVKVAIIDVDLVDSIDLCERFEVKSVPHVIIFKEKLDVQHFSGFRIEAINEVVSKLVKEYPLQSKVSHEKMKECPSKHQLSIVDALDCTIYVDGYFYCNNCKRIEKVVQGHNMGHCGVCDYDICHQCYSV